MPNSAAASSSVPKASSFARSGGGIFAPQSWVNLVICVALKMATTPGTSGTETPSLAGDVIAELEIIRVVEKQLREHKIRARVHFFLQMPPVGVLAGLVGDVAFGKTGDAHGKIARFADELHQFRGEFKAAGRGLELAAAGRIAAQGENVPAAGRADFFEQAAHLVARVADAGEMRQRGQRRAVAGCSPRFSGSCRAWRRPRRR